MKISIKRAYTDNIVFYTIDVQNARRFFPLPSKQNHSFTILVSFYVHVDDTLHVTPPYRPILTSELQPLTRSYYSVHILMLG